ncbi:MAG: hypothetical protein MR266_00470 [Erysipelotrichaceae bacterium]|nr:hypothetical protein [Erysipelotrichaceae bacterium]
MYAIDEIFHRLICESKKIKKTGNIISKYGVDYKIIVYNIRHNYIEYKCVCYSWAYTE